MRQKAKKTDFSEEVMDRSNSERSPYDHISLAELAVQNYKKDELIKEQIQAIKAIAEMRKAEAEATVATAQIKMAELELAKLKSKEGK